MKSKPLYLTADVIIEYEDRSIVLVKRGNDPFKGEWALPGGMLDGNETIEETAMREVKEETGLDVKLIEMLGIYSKPDRDPRGRYVSVTFIAVPIGGILQASSDAADILRTADFKDIKLAFDHNQMIADYLKEGN